MHSLVASSSPQHALGKGRKLSKADQQQNTLKNMKAMLITQALRSPVLKKQSGQFSISTDLLHTIINAKSVQELQLLQKQVVAEKVDFLKGNLVKNIATSTTASTTIEIASSTDEIATSTLEQTATTTEVAPANPVDTDAATTTATTTESQP